jgi:hypothetical protein
LLQWQCKVESIEKNNKENEYNDWKRASYSGCNRGAIFVFKPGVRGSADHGAKEGLFKIPELQQWEIYQ